MKLIKLTLLAATAAVAATAFIGVSSASALKHPELTVCLERSLLTCAKRPKHPLLGRFEFLAGKGLFKASFNIECASGTGASSEVQAQQEGALKASLEELNFVSCTGGCTKVKVITPQPAEANMESEGTETWRLKSANAKVEFFECTFGVKCKFEGTLNLKVQEDAEGIFADPEGTAFKLIEGSAILCGSTGKWESGRTRIHWLLDDAAHTLHKNIWIALIAELVITS